jgi:SAM-dependent methyltransferase
MNYSNHIIRWNKYYLINKLNVTWGVTKIDSHISDFINYLNLKWNKNSVIDVWCGYWKNASIFLDKGYDYTWIDISKEPIIYASDNIKRWKFILWDIMTFNFKNKFDIIIDAWCIHVNNKSKLKYILNKYLYILKDNWYIFIRLFKSDKINTKPLFMIDWYLPVWWYTKNEILKYFWKNFKINKLILDENYYKEDEIFYLYLSKK